MSFASATPSERTSARGSKRKIRQHLLALAAVLPVFLLDPLPPRAGLPGAASATMDRTRGASGLVDGWAGLPGLLSRLDQDRSTGLATMLYQVRLAAAGANCGRGPLPAPDPADTDATAAAIYDRLSCRPEPRQLRPATLLPLTLRLDLSPAPPRPPPILAGAVAAAIARAALVTGVRADLLRRTAAVESGLRPDAASPRSSARGLFQFLDATWLSTLRRYGPELGLSAAAREINVDIRGRPSIADPAARAQILALRVDPVISAALGGMLTRENAERLSTAGSPAPTPADLYAAHLLGAEGATKLLSYARVEPGSAAAHLFPRQARANHGLFFSAGRPRSVAELVETLTRRLGG